MGGGGFRQRERAVDHHLQLALGHPVDQAEGREDREGLGLKAPHQAGGDCDPGWIGDDLLAGAGAERQYQLSKKIMVYFELERLKMSRAASTARCDASLAIAAGVSAVAQRFTRGSDLTVSVAEGTVALDGAHLSAAIAELVANAFIFSKPGEPVTVTGVVHAGRYRIEVADQGPGMSPEQCARVGAFQQFGRAQQNQQGLGLGLAIARAAAELAGGQFLVQAGADGRGLHVTLDLPRFGRGITGSEVSGPESWDNGGE